MTAYDLTSSVIDRIAWKNRLLRFQALSQLRERAVARRRSRHGGSQAPDLPPDLIPALFERAIFVAERGVDVIGAAPAATLTAIARAGPAAWAWGGRPLLESEAILTQAPDAYRIGLDDALLDLAEAYLGEPCFYLGCSLKREKADGSTAGARQWHLDIEDDRMLRILLYLNDVDDGGGPFEYIAERDVPATRRAPAHRSGYRSDDAMAHAVAPEQWHTVTGRAGTLIAFDGTRLFHRASPPMARERFSLSLTFSSRHPRQVLRPVRLLAGTRRALVRGLSERQAGCLPAGRWY